jgi:hypothetical protein
MRSKNVTIQGKDGKAGFRFSDDTGDLLNFTVDSPLQTHTDSNEITMTINLVKMLPIFRLASTTNFKLNIIKNNIMHIVLDKIDILVMPEV